MRHGNRQKQELQSVPLVLLTNIVDQKLNAKTVELECTEMRTPRECANSVILGQLEQKAAPKVARHAQGPQEQTPANLPVRAVQRGSTKRMECVHFAQQEKSAQAERYARIVAMENTERETQQTHARNVLQDQSEQKARAMGARYAQVTPELTMIRAHAESVSCGNIR